MRCSINCPNRKNDFNTNLIQLRDARLLAERGAYPYILLCQSTSFGNENAESKKAVCENDEVATRRMVDIAANKTPLKCVHQVIKFTTFYRLIDIVRKVFVVSTMFGFLRWFGARLWLRARTRARAETPFMSFLNTAVKEVFKGLDYVVTIAIVVVVAVIVIIIFMFFPFVKVAMIWSLSNRINLKFIRHGC